MNSPEQPSQNRRIRVFVSSTFRDMMGERDELMTHAWPELRRFCRERQVELVEVDLRWGIAEEQSTRKETLKLCLDEIRACRPFFIGLLGERSVAPRGNSWGRAGCWGRLNAAWRRRQRQSQFGTDARSVSGRRNSPGRQS
jgi:hypothetical protein